MRLTRQSPVDGVEIPKLREAVSRKFGTYWVLFYASRYNNIALLRCYYFS
jgi:hypothetical protein